MGVTMASTGNDFTATTHRAVGVEKQSNLVFRGDMPGFG